MRPPAQLAFGSRTPSRGARAQRVISTRMVGDTMKQALLQRLTDAGIQDWCGKVLYSGTNTLKPGPVYMLGFNPGGDPAKEPMTLAEHVEQSPPDWNEYIDAPWMPRGVKQPPGRALLQCRVRWLLEKLELKPREVCASNLIFGRSRRAEDLPNKQVLVDRCWPVHQWIMEQVQPRMILGIGGAELTGYLTKKARVRFIGHYPSGHGNWTCRALEWNGIRLVVVPHLSLYAIDYHPDVIEWMKTLFPRDVRG
jgi:hypothetical protein